MIIMMQTAYNTYYIILSAVVSFLGAYIACNFCEQLRSSLGDKDLDRLERTGLIASTFHRYRHIIYLIFIALALGGVGIWAMHFIGMHALSLRFNGTFVTIKYNLGVTILTLITVLFMTSFGVIISSRDVMFGKSKREIMKTFLVQTEQKYSMKEVQKISHFRLLWVICTQQLHILFLGGVITGGGVCIMHYIGMEGVDFGGCIRWNFGIVATSVIVAIIAASAAFWILFRFLSIFPAQENLRIGASLLMAMAVTSMHCTGIVAATFVPLEFCTHMEKATTTKKVGDADESNNWSFIVTIIGTNVCLWFSIIFLLWDMRRTAQLKTDSLKQAESIICATAHYAMLSGKLPCTIRKYSENHGLELLAVPPCHSTTNSCLTDGSNNGSTVNIVDSIDRTASTRPASSDQKRNYRNQIIPFDDSSIDEKLENDCNTHDDDLAYMNEFFSKPSSCHINDTNTEV